MNNLGGGGVHYIYSDKVIDITDPNVYGPLAISRAGTVTYNTLPLNGTLPTDNLGGVGTSVASISMGVDFTNSQVTSYTVNPITTTYVVSVDASLQVPVPFTALNNNFALAGGTCSICSGTASVSFIGSNAEGAITSFSISDTSNTVSGTALLTDGTAVIQ